MTKISVKVARKAMAVALKEPGLRQSYLEKLIKLIFGSKRT